jgi:thiol-disulfide isomerase/thioredoxin
MDFWASWCGPCKVMDSELWKDPELQKISKNFVGVKINVDFEKTLVASYKVANIPKVVIVTASGDLIWEKDGFDNAESFLAVFEAIPQNVGELNKKSMVLANNKKDFQANYSVGLEFQRLGKDIKNDELKNSFLNCSNEYFRKTLKSSIDTVLAEEVEFNLILNEVYCGRIQSALKMIEKMDPKPEDENIAEFRHFILAKCYKSVNDQDNFQKEKQQVKKKELLAQLED